MDNDDSFLIYIKYFPIIAVLYLFMTNVNSFVHKDFFFFSTISERFSGTRFKLNLII